MGKVIVFSWCFWCVLGKRLPVFLFRLKKWCVCVLVILELHYKGITIVGFLVLPFEPSKMSWTELFVLLFCVASLLW